MNKIFKTSKRSISAILTLCILLGIAGTCVYAATVMAEETTIVTEETTQELMPMMARGCDNVDYSEYDGKTFSSTADALYTIGIPFSGNGKSIELSNPKINIKFGQRGTTFCVWLINEKTNKEICWFKVKQW